MKKLILFDIDGTLLSTRGAARRAFHQAMLEVYGTTGPIATHPFDGKTDPQIARELLRADGMPDDRIDAGLDRLFASYLGGLERELAEPGHETSVYPGVRQLLDRLAEREDAFVLALLTGNIAGGARAKLGSAGLAHYFDFGAFGSDCEQRTGLPLIAVDRAEARTGKRFTGRDVVVIGDTPADVTCGRSLDVHAIGVATGSHDRAALEAAGAHTALPDLADTEDILALLLDGHSA